MVTYRPSRVAEPPEGCPLTECMALLGGAWTPNIIWYLREGPRRFNELRGDITESARRSSPPACAGSPRTASSPARSCRPHRPRSSTADGVRPELLPAVDAIVAVGHRIKQRANV